MNNELHGKVIAVDEAAQMTEEDVKILGAGMHGGMSYGTFKLAGKPISSPTMSATPEDGLDTMFRMQYELQKFLGTDFNMLSISETVKNIKEYSLMAQIEIGEMLNELPFLKAWKDYTTMTSEEVDVAMEKAREEYIDVVHFMINVGLLLDFSGSDIVDAYKAKNRENYERQRNKWNKGTHYTYKE